MTRQRLPELGDGTKSTEAPKAAVHTDEALRLAAKIDRLLEKMPAWGRMWALNFLWAKYMRAPAATTAGATERSEP